jgi:hypothetical protein
MGGLPPAQTDPTRCPAAVNAAIRVTGRMGESRLAAPVTRGRGREGMRGPRREAIV